jgi:hypothetical protein
VAAVGVAAGKVLGGVLDSTTRRQPPKSEFRRPNTEGRSHARAFRISGFGLLSGFGLRNSGLGLCAHGLVVLSRYARCWGIKLIRFPGWLVWARVCHQHHCVS